MKLKENAGELDCVTNRCNLLRFWMFGECYHIKPTGSSLEVFSLYFFGKWKVKITHVQSEMSWCLELISNSRSLSFLLSIGCRQQWRRLPAEEGTCPASAGLHQLLDTEVSHSHPTWVTWFKVYISVSIKHFEACQQWARVDRWDRSSSVWLQLALSKAIPKDLSSFCLLVCLPLAAVDFHIHAWRSLT